MSEIELAARVRKPVMQEVSAVNETDSDDVESVGQFGHWRSEASTLFNLKDTIARANSIRHEIQELFLMPLARINSVAFSGASESDTVSDADLGSTSNGRGECPV